MSRTRSLLSEERTSEPMDGGWVTISASGINYDKVIFLDIPKTYAIKNIIVYFEKTNGISTSLNDYVGIYKIGFKDVSECLLKAVQPAEGHEAHVVFTAEELRNLDETEFYQFVYVSNENNIYGASTPFQLEQPSEGDFAETSEDDFLVVHSLLKEKNVNSMQMAENLQSDLCAIKQLKEENVNSRKEIEKLESDLSAEGQNNRNHIVDGQLKEEKINLKKEIEKLKSDLSAEVQNNRNHIVDGQLKEENINLKKEIEKLKSDLCAEAQNNINCIADKQSIEKKDSTDMNLAQNVNAAIENEATESSFTCISWEKEYAVLYERYCKLGDEKHFLNKKTAQLEQKVAEQAKTLAEDIETIKKYHFRIKTLERRIHDNFYYGQNSANHILRRELLEKESQLEAIKQSKTLVLQELERKKVLHIALNTKVAELLVDEAQLANQVSKFEEAAMVAKKELQKALINVEIVETDKKHLQSKIAELEETIERSKESLKRAAKEKVYDREAIKKLTEHMNLNTDHLMKVDEEHTMAVELIKREHDEVVADMKARLDEASNIFKKQYREIKKLKKMVKILNATKLKSENQFANVKEREFPESPVTKYVSDDDDASPSSSPKNSSDGPVNDSDTGEHVGLLDLKPEPFSDVKSEGELKNIRSVPSSRISPNTFSNSANGSTTVDSKKKSIPGQRSCKQPGSSSEEHYFGAAYTAQPTFTYPIETPLPRRHFPMPHYIKMMIAKQEKKRLQNF